MGAYIQLLFFASWVPFVLYMELTLQKYSNVLLITALTFLVVVLLVFGMFNYLQTGNIFKFDLTNGVEK